MTGAHRPGHMTPGPDMQPCRFYVLSGADLTGERPLLGPCTAARARILCESVPGSRIVTMRQLAALQRQSPQNTERGRDDHDSGTAY